MFDSVFVLDSFSFWSFCYKIFVSFHGDVMFFCCAVLFLPSHELRFPECLIIKIHRRPALFSVRFLSVSVSSVFLSVLSTCSPKLLEFWSFFFEWSHVFLFFISLFVVLVSEERKMALLLDFLGQTQSVLWEHGRKQNVSAEKNASKRSKKF